jgi:succinate dehydrogenase / fumarate reductase cytochrome b subunit
MPEPKLQTTSSHMLQDIDPGVAKVDVLRRHSVGMKAWIIHRISGVGLLLYLLAHIGTMGTAMFMGDEAFKRTFEILFHTPIFIFFDLIILAGLILHALNGIRLVIMDMGFLVTKQRQLFTVILLMSGGIFIWLVWRVFL